MCIAENVPDCDLSFMHTNDPCGNYSFQNTSQAPTQNGFTWNFTGPGLPPAGVNSTQTNPDFNFPTSGAYTVKLSYFCTPTLLTTSEVINVIKDQMPPIIIDCPGPSGVLMAQPPACLAQFTVPEILAFDDNDITEIAYFHNGSPVGGGQVLNLPVGNHSFAFVATDICGNTGTCFFSVNVECIPSAPSVMPCTNFNDQMVGGWGVYNNSNSIVTYTNNNVIVGSPGPSNNGATDFYLHFQDVQGGTWALNNTDYNGNWLGNIGKCLCYDYKVLDDSNPATLPVVPAIHILGPFNPSQPVVYGSNPALMARFVPNSTVTELDGWGHFCAPLEACAPGNVLPSNSTGHWEFVTGAGATCNDWNALLSNIGGIVFGLDLTPNPAEEIQIDNICVQDCGTVPQGPCDGLDDGKKDAWTIISDHFPLGGVAYNNSKVTVGAPGPSNSSTDYYIQFMDISAATWAIDSVDYSGDWRPYYGQCLCYDYKLVDDGSPNSTLPPVSPAIYISNSFDALSHLDPGSNPLLMAYFSPSQMIT